MNRRQFDFRSFTCSLCNRGITYDTHFMLENCRHIFHTRCLRYYFIQYYFSCPVCNERLSNDDENLFRQILNQRLQRPIIIGEIRNIQEQSEDSGYESD